MNARWITLIAVVAAVGVGIFIGKQGNASQPTPAPIPPHIVKKNLTGTWEVHKGKAVEILTMEDKDGVLTGEIKEDSAWGNQVSPVTGIRAGENVQWSYNFNFETGVGTATETASYTMKGTVKNNSMEGAFTTYSPSAAAAAAGALNQTSLWVAERKSLDR